MTAGSGKTGREDMAGQNKPKIILLDDEENIRRSLATFLRMNGYAAAAAARPEEALSLLSRGDARILLTDVRMPGEDGLSFAEKVRSLHPEVEILVMTAYGNIRDAVRALKNGCCDYLTKPLDEEELLLVLERIRERDDLVGEVRALRARLRMDSPYDGLVGNSPPMREVYGLIDRAGESDLSVLVLGETGTGKEMVAQAIHHASRRQGGPLVPVNCASLSETIMESELFGHLRGAYTGAVRDRMGKIRSAHGGTLFLDEVSTLSPSAQAKLLRVLDERKCEPVGGDRPVEVDIRVIAATNEDLAAAIRTGKFREDLYYRLNVLHIDLPPLRERKEDIPALAGHFLSRMGRGRIVVSPEAMNALLCYDWPGNIRELENALKSAAHLMEGNRLLPAHLPEAVRPPGGPSAPPIPGAASLKERLAVFEKFLIEEKLRETGGNVARAARELDFPLRSFRRKLARHSLRARTFKGK